MPLFTENDVKEMLILAEQAMDDECNRKYMNDICDAAKADPEVAGEADESMRNTKLMAKVAAGIIPFATQMLGDQWEKFGVNETDLLTVVKQIEIMFPALDPESQDRSLKLLDLVMKGKVGEDVPASGREENLD